MLLPGCTASLPPPEVLESGCHVWFSRDGTSGIYAAVTPDGKAKVKRRTQTTDATLSSSGDVVLEWGRSIVVARFEQNRLTVSGLGENLSPAYFADIGPAPSDIALRHHKDGDHWTKLRRSKVCTPAQTAVGAGPVAYYLNWEWVMKPPPRAERDDPLRPDR